MYINANNIRKLNTELSFVVEALLKGDKVWQWNGPGKDNGWCTTEQVNMFKNKEDYYVGDIPPADKG